MTAEDLEELKRLAEEADKIAPNWQKKYFPSCDAHDISYENPEDPEEHWLLGDCWEEEIIDYLYAVRPSRILELLASIES